MIELIEFITKVLFVTFILYICVRQFRVERNDEIPQRSDAYFFNINNYEKEFLSTWLWQDCKRYAFICYDMEEGKFIPPEDLRWHQERVDEISESKKKKKVSSKG